MSMTQYNIATTVKKKKKSFIVLKTHFWALLELNMLE